MAPEVGTEAPDFTLKDQNNQEVALSSFRGDRNVLVVFYPFAFSGICTGELCAVRDDLAAFQNSTVQILAVSVDHPYALKAWADAEGYDVPAARRLLAARRGRAGVRGVQRQGGLRAPRHVPGGHDRYRALRGGQRPRRAAQPGRVAEGPRRPV
jgi:hypothetical protein